MAELSKACGIKAGVVAVTDEGFAGALLKEYGELPESQQREKEE